MKIILTIALAFITSIGQWSSKEYGNFTVKTFFERKDVNQPINAKHFDPELLEAAIFYATNEVRIKKSKAVFIFDSLLAKSSNGHSQAMLQDDFFDHENKNNLELKTLKNRLDKVGGNFRGFAENIALFGIYKLGKKGTYFVNGKGVKVDSKGKALKIKTYKELGQEVLKSWMKSRGHRVNILAKYKYLGCGVSEIKFGEDNFPEIYITQNFGLK